MMKTDVHMTYIEKLHSAKGIILGIVAAVSYGTNPLFAVPLYREGFTVSSVLFYRYAFATLLLGLIMMLKGDSFRLTRRELPIMVLMGVLFALSSVTLFDSYNYMDVGLASTLLFMEPVFIVLILWIFYHDKISRMTLLAVAVCLSGVVCLCNPGVGSYVTARGVTLVLMSSLAYGIYMVAVNKTRVGMLPGLRITFYSLLFGQIVFAFTTDMYTEVQAIPCDPLVAACIVGISIIPTIISLLTVAISIKYIGSVAVAILGAFEPMTGLLVGCTLFGERLTVRAVIGIVLILSSVIVVVKSTNESNNSVKN